MILDSKFNGNYENQVYFCIGTIVFYINVKNRKTK